MMIVKSDLQEGSSDWLLHVIEAHLNNQALEASSWHHTTASFNQNFLAATNSHIAELVNVKVHNTHPIG